MSAQRAWSLLPFNDRAELTSPQVLTSIQGYEDAVESTPGAPALAVHEVLPADALRRRCDSASLGFRSTEELTDLELPFGQERAARALRLAVDMKQPGYNVFALGEPGVGMLETVMDMLSEYAASQPEPRDWVYVENFDRPAEPRALSLPNGVARRFAADMQKLVDDLRVAVPAAFETREYASKIEGFFDTCRVLGTVEGQGVIVPRANVEHLMLRTDVAEAAARGALRIYPVDTIDDAMEILTDMPAGKPNENGESPEGTLSFVIEQQLLEFAVVAKRFGEMFETEKPESPERDRSRREDRQRRQRR